MRAGALSAAFAAALLVAPVTSCRRAAANPVPGGDPARGEQAFVAMGCASCHTVRGARGPHGHVGPELTGIGAQSYVAGVLPNTPENMVRWIMDPQGVNPRTAMPNLHVTEQGARDLAAYLYTRR